MRVSGFRRSRIAAMAMAMLVCIATSNGWAQSMACAALDADRVLPDVAVCLVRSGIAVPASSPVAAADALFAHAEGRIAAGRFDDAGFALDCADAVLGANGDALSRYELVRRRGILDYRRERIPEALSRFECAVAMARAREDSPAVAKDLKNVGSALRRLGDFKGALAALEQSLRLQRADGEVGGMVLRNIADVYRELDEPMESMRHYRSALDAFRRAGDRVETGHTLETMSLIAHDDGDSAQAERWLEEALRIYRDADHKPYQLRAYSGLIRVALARGELPRAREWRRAALSAAAEYDLPMPAPLRLQIARLERRDGRLDAARERIAAALGDLPERDPERIPLLQELVDIHEGAGDPTASLAALQRLREAERGLERAQHDRQLGWLRARFETAERDRRIAALEHENRVRTLTVRLISVSALAALLGLSMLFMRWRQRLRFADVERRAKHEEELARYRREADALAEDRSMLQTLLDSREEAICLLDADGVLLAANRGACDRLAVAREEANGRPLAEMLVAADADVLSSALERMQDTDRQIVAFAGPVVAGPVVAGHVPAQTSRVELSHWDRGDGLIVLTLRDQSSASAAEVPLSTADAPVEADETRAEFRRALVALMLAAIDAWESATGTSRLELAEKSRIWRVNIDDGRLRARVMERYLAVPKLPANPRWRDVVRTAYFVLGHTAMDADARDALRRRIDSVLTYTRRSALV